MPSFLFFRQQHLPGYLERQAAARRAPVRNAAAAVPDADMEVELPRAHAAQFALPSQQDLNAALVQLGQDLLIATPAAAAARPPSAQ
jgi:hypothetical protein